MNQKCDLIFSSRTTRNEKRVFIRAWGRIQIRSTLVLISLLSHLVNRPRVGSRQWRIRNQPMTHLFTVVVRSAIKMRICVYLDGESQKQFENNTFASGKRVFVWFDKKERIIFVLLAFKRVTNFITLTRLYVTRDLERSIGHKFECTLSCKLWQDRIYFPLRKQQFLLGLDLIGERAMVRVQICLNSYINLLLVPIILQPKKL